MKSIKQHIKEALKINSKSKVIKTNYKYFPKTKEELKAIIEQRIKSKGNTCDLNDIDVSKITNMHRLFYNSDFNGDISKWDVSNVKYMSRMFMISKFNGDISKWNVSNVTEMTGMFMNSKFNKDISKWDVSNVKNMAWMFRWTNFNQDISKWDVSNVTDYDCIFDKCPIVEKYKPKFK